MVRGVETDPRQQEYLGLL